MPGLDGLEQLTPDQMLQLQEMQNAPMLRRMQSLRDQYGGDLQPRPSAGGAPPSVQSFGNYQRNVTGGDITDRRAAHDQAKSRYALDLASSQQSPLEQVANQLKGAGQGSLNWLYKNIIPLLMSQQQPQELPGLPDTLGDSRELSRPRSLRDVVDPSFQSAGPQGPYPRFNTNGTSSVRG